MSAYEAWKHEEASLRLAELVGPNAPGWDHLHDELMEDEEFDQRCRNVLVELAHRQTTRIAELQRRVGIGQLIEEPLRAESGAGQPLSARLALVRAYNALSPAQHSQLRADLYATLQQLVP